MRIKKDFYGTTFAIANLAESLAQDLLEAAILAVGARRLPFWQSLAAWIG